MPGPDDLNVPGVELEDAPPWMPAAAQDEAAATPADWLTEAPELSAFLPDAWATLERRARGDDNPAPIPWTGVAKRLGGGLWPGLFVLTGGTGTGKTQWALQAALHAALEGWPVLYCGLELDREGVVARLAGMLARRHWSTLYLGRKAEQVAPRAEHRREAMELLERVKAETGETLAGLPFRLDMGPPFGWSYDRLVTGVQAMRAAHGRPPVVVLDFLQLVTSPNDREREDLRERIGRAAYMGRQAARDHGAAVLLLSATARGNYGSLNLKARATQRKPGKPPRVLVQTMEAKPQPRPLAGELVGLGKESGEVEYSADFVLTLAAEWPRRKDERGIKAQGGRAGRWALSEHYEWRPVHVAVCKTRAGAGIGWEELGFNGSWFGELEHRDREALRAWREPPPGEVDEDEDEGAPEAAATPSGGGEAGKPKPERSPG